MRVSDDHVSLPVILPSLDHLTHEELGALRTRFAGAAREARRKANQTIQRFEALKKPWSRSLSIEKKTPPEERAEILQTFEKELLRVPEAFLAHAYANSLVLLEAVCREEIVRRSGEAPKKKARAEPEVAPAPPPLVPISHGRQKRDQGGFTVWEPKVDPLPEPVEPATPAEEKPVLDERDALAAMFAQAGDEPV